MSRTRIDRRDLAVIAIGGLVGAAVRHWVTDVDPPAGGWFAYAPNTTIAIAPGHAIPWRTLAVNLAGCLVLGAVLAVRARATHGPARLWLGIGTGFCGSLTTFSTFAVEVAQRVAVRTPTGHVTVGTNVSGFEPSAPNVAVINEGLTPLASGLVYLALSLAGGVAAFWLGRTLAATTHPDPIADPEPGS